MKCAVGGRVLTTGRELPALSPVHCTAVRSTKRQKFSVLTVTSVCNIQLKRLFKEFCHAQCVLKKYLQKWRNFRHSTMV